MIVRLRLAVGDLAVARRLGRGAIAVLGSNLLVTMKNRQTLGEVMSELETDPTFILRRAEADRHRLAAKLEHRALTAPILEDLKGVGCSVVSLDQLRRSGVPYPEAVPILLRWLPIVADLGVKDSIVRCLAVPWAKKIAAAGLLEEFRNTSKDLGSRGMSFKWTIGHALETVATQADFTELAEIARDRSHGRARQTIVLALGRVKTAEGLPILIELLRDEDVSHYAVKALRRLKKRVSAPAIEPLLNDPSAFVREAARKVLSAL